MSILKYLLKKKDKHKLNYPNVIYLKEYKKKNRIPLNNNLYVIYDYYYDKEKFNLLTKKDIENFEKLLEIHREVSIFIITKNIPNKKKEKLLTEVNHLLLELKHNDDVSIYISILLDYKKIAVDEIFKVLDFNKKLSNI